MSADHRESCTECGTRELGRRVRGLCVYCYNRALHLGIHTSYPRLGRGALMRMEFAQQPAPVPALVTLDMLGLDSPHDDAFAMREGYNYASAAWENRPERWSTLRVAEEGRVVA